MAIQEKENKEEECRIGGHDFKKWKHEKWTDYVRTVFDHQWVEKYPVDHECWCRTCKRCGFEGANLFDHRGRKTKARKRG